jgi:hypothetical protein
VALSCRYPTANRIYLFIYLLNSQNKAVIPKGYVPQWERRLLRFLELSGVGRVMDDKQDEEVWWPENETVRLHK